MLSGQAQGVRPSSVLGLRVSGIDVVGGQLFGCEDFEVHGLFRITPCKARAQLMFCSMRFSIVGII